MVRQKSGHNMLYKPATEFTAQRKIKYPCLGKGCVIDKKFPMVVLLVRKCCETTKDTPRDILSEKEKSCKVSGNYIKAIVTLNCNINIFTDRIHGFIGKKNKQTLQSLDDMNEDLSTILDLSSPRHCSCFTNPIMNLFRAFSGNRNMTSHINTGCTGDSLLRLVGMCMCGVPLSLVHYIVLIDQPHPK